jgi:hypothetical protein
LSRCNRADPGVPVRDTSNVLRQRQTTFVAAPNQNLNATADSVRMARFNSSLTHSPEPPRCPIG